MKILVTGGAGFIGSHTADALLECGYEVRILDNLTEPIHKNGTPLYIPQGAEFIKGDVRNKEDWKKALKGVDIVYHFAAYQDYFPDFSKFFHVNTVGSSLLYEIAVENKLPLKKIIIASSQAVYGEGKYMCKKDGIQYPNIRLYDQLEKGMWEVKCSVCGKIMEPQGTDESRTNPQNQYAISKYSQELVAINLGKRYSIPTVCLRYSIVQGPRQSFYNTYSGAMRIFCLNLFLGNSPTIYEDGNQIRDYVNVQDAVNANLLVLENNDANYGIYNVGGEKTYTVKQFYDKVAEIFGMKIKPKIPGEYRYGDTRHIFSDISKLKRIGWKPKIPIEQSIKEYKQYLEEQTDIEDILEFQLKKMRNLNIVREAKV
jgi:dTDP-L-rhamnose 4-epimerase